MNPNSFPPTPPEHTNTPNLWRLACEIAGYKNPDRVLAGLLAILKEANHDEQ